MPSLVTKIILSVLGAGGVTSAVLVPTLLTRGGRPPEFKWDDYKRECYKLLVNMNTGELIACSGRKVKWEDSALFFLWWTKDLPNDKFFPVSQIQVDNNSNQVSFLGKGDKQITGSDGQPLKLEKGQDLKNLPNKPLKNEKCKVQNNQLQCSSGTFELVEKGSTNFYI